MGSELTDGYPEFTMAMLKQLGWDGDLTAEERAAIEAVAGDKTNWKTDLSGGIQRVAIKPMAARRLATPRRVAWCGTFPDPIPIHREPLYTQRGAILWRDYPTYEDRRSSTACQRSTKQSKTRISPTTTR